MKQYIELPVECIELDKSNPRIARGVAYYGENITSDIRAILHRKTIPLREYIYLQIQTVLLMTEKA